MNPDDVIHYNQMLEFSKNKLVFNVSLNNTDSSLIDQLQDIS